MGQVLKFDQLLELAERTDTRLDAVESGLEAIEIPSKVSDLENDAGYQTAEQVQAAAAAAAAGKMTAVKAESVEDIDLTAADADRHIYLVPNGEEEGDDICDEYIVVDGALEKIGSGKIDVDGLVEKVEGKGLSSNDFTDADKAKLDSLEFVSDEEFSAALDEIYGPKE